MNRYEAFPDIGAASRRRDGLVRRRIIMIAFGAVLLIGAVIATVLFGSSLMRRQANTTWGVITAVSAPAASPAMAASLAAKRASFTQSALSPVAASDPPPASDPPAAAAPAPAPPAAAPAAAPSATAAAAPAPASAPVSIDQASKMQASKMMDTAALADKPVVKDPPVADKLPSLTVAPTIHATSGQAAAFAVSVDNDGVLPDNSSISIHGVPQEIALSAGHRDATGDWLLSPGDLSGLTITPNDTMVASTTDLLIQLKTADGKVENEWHTVLNVTSAAKPQDQAAAGFAITEKASADDIKSWMSHGRDLERVGYLAGARLFYQRAAEAGSAEGARAMAATYDPAVFAKLGVHGLEPDPAQAQKWYERAKMLEAKSGGTQ